MRKFALIPVVNLGSDLKVVFLEIMSEPAYFGRWDFQNVKNSGLTKEVATTEKILTILNVSKIAPSCLYLSHHLSNINSLSISLGLTLAAFLQQQNCPYHKIIAIGEVDINNPQLTISGGQYFETQIKAVLALGVQPYKVAFFVPAHLLNNTDQDLVQRLAALNIELKEVVTLKEAITCLTKL